MEGDSCIDTRSTKKTFGKHFAQEVGGPAHMMDIPKDRRSVMKKLLILLASIVLTTATTSAFAAMHIQPNGHPGWDCGRDCPEA